MLGIRHARDSDDDQEQGVEKIGEAIDPTKRQFASPQVRHTEYGNASLWAEVALLSA